MTQPSAPAAASMAGATMAEPTITGATIAEATIAEAPTGTVADTGATMGGGLISVKLGENTQVPHQIQADMVYRTNPLVPAEDCRPEIADALVSFSTAPILLKYHKDPALATKLYQRYTEAKGAAEAASGTGEEKENKNEDQNSSQNSGQNSGQNTVQNSDQKENQNQEQPRRVQGSEGEQLKRPHPEAAAENTGEKAGENSGENSGEKSGENTRVRGQNKKRKVNTLAATEAWSSQVCHEFAAQGTCRRGDSCNRSHDLTARLEQLKAEAAAQPKPSGVPSSEPAPAEAKEGSVALDVKSFGSRAERHEAVPLPGVGLVFESCPFNSGLGIACPHGVNCAVGALEHVDLTTGRNLSPVEGRPPVTPQEASISANRGVINAAYQFIAASKNSRRNPQGPSAVKKHTQNPLQHPLENPLQNPLENPLQNPLQGPVDNPLQDSEAVRPEAVRPEAVRPEAVRPEPERPEEASATSTAETTSALSTAPTSAVRTGCVIEGKERLTIDEKRQIMHSKLKGKLILAPLTTVGNLPFRRLCVKFGADATVSEMIPAASIIQLRTTDLALLKRHSSEKLFGVQLAGGCPKQMGAAARILAEGNVSCDWIELNAGCPLADLERRGAGCALLNRIGKMRDIFGSLNQHFIDLPVTLKTRTGFHGKREHSIHQILPQLLADDFGIASLTLHGRTARQRYLREADWSFIGMCARGIKELPNETCTIKPPLVGNGDLFDPMQVVDRWRKSEVNAVMIGRGALIKPWIFEEVKRETRLDVSSSERFDMLKLFCNYGLEHWGCDSKGLETTRRFLLEQLSFLHRYIPVGILERVPQHLNHKPPEFVGRNDLETLMGSPNVKDWVRISEMLLGPVSESFQFLPKHKSNSYEPVAAG